LAVERMCCVCRARKKTHDMIRVARIEGKFYINKIDGRGCYLCPTCIDKAIKTRALNRSFKTNVGNEIYIELAKLNELVYTKK